MKFTKFGQIYTHNIIVILITFKYVIAAVLNKIICMKYNISICAEDFSVKHTRCNRACQKILEIDA